MASCQRLGVSAAIANSHAVPDALLASCDGSDADAAKRPPQRDLPHGVGALCHLISQRRAATSPARRAQGHRENPGRVSAKPR